MMNESWLCYTLATMRGSTLLHPSLHGKVGLTGRKVPHDGGKSWRSCGQLLLQKRWHVRVLDSREGRSPDGRNMQVLRS